MTTFGSDIEGGHMTTIDRLFAAVVRLEQELAGVARLGPATPVPSARSRA